VKDQTSGTDHPSHLITAGEWRRDGTHPMMTVCVRVLRLAVGSRVCDGAADRDEPRVDESAGSFGQRNAGNRHRRRRPVMATNRATDDQRALFRLRTHSKRIGTTGR